MTKVWSALLYGVMEREGLISVKDTLGDVWTDPDVWAQADNAEARKNITIEYLLQMRTGLTMPEKASETGGREKNPTTIRSSNTSCRVCGYLCLSFFITWLTGASMQTY